MTEEPLEEIVEDRQATDQERGRLGSYVHVLRCGHVLSKDWSKKYGKRRRCYVCRNNVEMLKSLNELDTLVRQLKRGDKKIGQESYTDMGFACRDFIKAWERIERRQNATEC